MSDVVLSTQYEVLLYPLREQSPLAAKTLTVIFTTERFDWLAATFSFCAHGLRRNLPAISARTEVGAALRHHEVLPQVRGGSRSRARIRG